MVQVKREKDRERRNEGRGREMRGGLKQLLNTEIRKLQAFTGSWSLQIYAAS